MTRVSDLKPMPLRMVTRTSEEAPLPPHIPAGSVPFPDAVPLISLSRAIRRWLRRALLRSGKRFRVPRLLVVQGPPGTGKTWTVLNTAAATHNVATYPAASLLAGVEGAHIEALEAWMQGLVTLSRATGKPSLGLLDDADVILSRPESMQTTINQAGGDVWLMTLADRHDLHVNVDGTPIRLVLCGNSYERTRSAVLRDGRAEIVTHAPTLEERIAVAQQSLGVSTETERSLVAETVTAFADEPLALWPAVAADLDNQRLDAALDQHGDDDAAIERVLAYPVALTREALSHAIVARLTSGRARNFL